MIKVANVSKSLRYEVKFISYIYEYGSILNWLKFSEFNFKKQYPDRQVNSIYFDTPDLNCLADSLDGMSKRQKLRYRWYGSSLTPDSGTLEVKHKKNNLGWKELYKVKNKPYSDNYTWNNIISQIKSQVPDEALFYFNLYDTPVLTNRYERQYYESSNKKLRVTIDNNQKFYQQNSKLIPNFIKNKYFPKILTVEIKCDLEFRDMASKMLKNIPFRHSKYSKFAEGLLT